MRYLIDTHTLLWVLFDDEKLSTHAAGVIADYGNEVYVSVVTYWKIALKYGIGKLELKGITPADLPGKAHDVAITTLAVSESEVATVYQLPVQSCKDPFDRMISWQAIQRNMPLISKDKGIREYISCGLQVEW